MRLYLAGPMTGLPESNYTAFHAEAARLRAAGFDVANPAENDCGQDPEWSDWMRSGIRLLLTCDEVATLDGWWNSRGAVLEVDLATRLGMRVRPSLLHANPNLVGVP